MSLCEGLKGLKQSLFLDCQKPILFKKTNEKQSRNEFFFSYFHTLQLAAGLLINKGGNYGWDIMEGTDCHDPPLLCDRSGLLLAVVAYSRNLGGSVIGGHVYRGSTIRELRGSFIYGDFLSGRLWALLFNGIDPTVNTEILRFDPFSLISFGIDENNEIFVCSFDGSIYTLIRNIA